MMMTLKKKVTVFSAINRARKEMYVGATTLPMNALIASFRAAPPAEMRSWEPQDAVEYRSHEFELDAEDAPGCIERYAAAREGWRILTADRIIES
jgi:hypothetical protein